jgi:uncharacterized protein (DUF58 family)
VSTILSRYLDPEVLQQTAGHPLQPSELVAGNLAGAHKSPFSGFAVEFAGHREYVLGDDPRHIDWRLYYKRDRMFVKQYQMETNFVCHLLLDISASMRYGVAAQQKLQYAASLAATLAYGIVRQNDKVSLGLFDNQVRGWLPPGSSLAQITRLTQLLDEMQPIEKTELQQCLTDFTGRMGRREIVMIFSDFFVDVPALEAVLQQLKYRRHEVVLFHVLHPHEWTFDFEGMIKFVGLEDSSEYLTQSDDIRAGYLSALNSAVTELDALCHRNQIERVAVDTSRPAANVLLDYLQLRSQIQLR